MLKNTFVGLNMMIAATSVNAGTVKAFVCYTHCLGVNTAHRSVEFLGAEPKANETRVGAWGKANKACEKKARSFGTGALLAKNYATVSLDQSHTSIYEENSFYYGRTLTVSSTHTVYQNDQFQLDVDLLNPSDCKQEDVPEEMLQEYYEGPLPVRG